VVLVSVGILATTTQTTPPPPRHTRHQIVLAHVVTSLHRICITPVRSAAMRLHFVNTVRSESSDLITKTFESSLCARLGSINTAYAAFKAFVQILEKSWKM